MIFFFIASNCSFFDRYDPLIADTQVLGIKMTQDEMHSLLSEIDVTYNGQMELQDYLQVNHLNIYF